MRRLLLLMVMVIFSFQCSIFNKAVAQSYKSLWKQVRTAEEKDQPKSALEAIEKISRKAEKQKDYGNLLAAMMKELYFQREIAPDSLKAAKARLAERRAQWRKEGKGVEATLAQFTIYNLQSTVYSSFVDSLMASPDSALYRKAGKAHGYAPFIEKGEDSRYFDNDLLSLIILSDDKGVKTTDLLEKYYGKDNKVVMWRRVEEAISDESNPGKKIALIDKALTEWKDWKEINELRNRRADITRPQYYATISEEVVTTRKDVMLFFRNVRNIHSLKITLNSDKGATRTFTHDFKWKSEWEYIEKDSVSLGMLPFGKWKLTISGGETEEEIGTLYVTDMKVIEMALPENRLRVVVADATTGEPVEGATVYYRRQRDKEQVARDRSVTDKNGECVIAKKDVGMYGNDYYTYATKGEDTAMPPSAIWTNYRAGKAQAVQNYLELYADRAIYRRGQTVHVTALCHAVLNGKETLPSPRERVLLSLRDRRNREVAQKTVVTDEYGTATADFLIPEEGENGMYHISGMGSARGSVSFRVEDYKRPTFEVSLDDANANLNPNANKDTTVIVGTVKTYSGVPVANAKVAYEVRRMAGFWYGGSGESLLKDTLYTDADGKFYATMPMPLPRSVDEKWYYLYRYILKAEVTDNTGESHSKSITLTRENDRPLKPHAPEKPKHVSASAESFNEKNEPVVITLRNPNANVYAFYTICAGDSVIEKSMIEFRDSTTYALTYKEEYGDGVTFSVAWVKDGEMVNDNVQIKKFLPSKKLTMEWGTFRDKLYPGQTETWTLWVKDEGRKMKDEGDKGKVQVMAVMYDKSLDAITPHKWRFADNRSLFLPTMGWNTGSIGSCSFWGSKPQRVLEYKNLLFNRIAEEFNFGNMGYYYSGPPMLYAKAGKMNDVMMLEREAPLMMAQEESVTVGYASRDESASDGEESESVETRKDFSETAFFLPQVLTDRNGVATLKFTMPESVTTWRFMALAHDKEMRYALMDTTALTQKKIMVQAKMPRFLRVGDKSTVSASVANLMEKNQKVTVNFTVKDAETEKVMHSESKSVVTEAGRTASVTFAYDVKQEGDLVYCFTAKIPGFSDGEQHLLPVLTEKELEPDTAAIVVNPRKMLMEALPELQVPKSCNAVTLAHAMYANVVAALLRDTIVSPANDNVLAQLINLQHADGGFAWYSGMRSNKYVTIEVLKTLARLNRMVSDKGQGTREKTQFMMDKAFAYAKNAMTEEMREMKKHDTRYLSSTALDWLYTLAISGKDGGSAESFFRKMIYEETKYDDMQTKAVSAITLNENGKKKKAAEFVESIKQHTVYRADMGRYFDSYRAAYSWCNYRIPTQTMCIEAMKDVTPEDEQTIGEMQRWIVSAKRTQRWDNPINTVNAIYALHDVKDSTILATYTVKPEDIQGALTVSRELKAGGKAVESLKVGEKVKVRLTIVADRDYDFVTVTDNRPACLEPVNQLSGYCWYGFWGCYAEMRDSKSVYHLDKMAKGTHVIETEYYISRTGEYQSGNATVVCEYAPEFRGNADAFELKVKN